MYFLDNLLDILCLLRLLLMIFYPSYLLLVFLSMHLVTILIVLA